ncbi:hypothetical protein Anapl_10086 [Anas platyrhynchos]|uniref:Uncharacterized protein n=1 Tax=Anas platyrhynchos TaxID=8839 RepID=R0JV47_ANAPL|nr:hypothetical protein Anapl_10086 [Anas platyrhynchos]
MLSCFLCIDFNSLQLRYHGRSVHTRFQDFEAVLQFAYGYVLSHRDAHTRTIDGAVQGWDQAAELGAAYGGIGIKKASCPGTMWQAGSARVQLLEELLNPEQRDSATYCYRLVPGRVSAVRINSAWLTKLLLLLDHEVKGKRKVF